MPKILVNFKYNKKTDTYSIIDNGVVFADLPIAIMDMGVDYEHILIVPIDGNNVVVERDEYLKINKLFNFKIKNEQGDVEETSENPDFSLYLSKDTDVKTLKYINGRLFKVEPEPEPEKKEGEEQCQNQ